MSFWTYPEWLPAPVADMLRALRPQRFPQARAVLLYGSCLATQGARFKDVDLLVLLPGRGEGVMEKLSLTDAGVTLDLTIIPESLIPALPDLSLRMGLPVGLFALVNGQVIGGEFPQLDEMRPAMRSAIQSLERAQMPRRIKPLQEARSQLEAALAATTPEARRALAVVALGRITEAELMRGADSAFASPGMMARAAEDPALAQKLGQIAQVILSDRADLLQGLLDKLPKAEPPPLRVDPARFGIKF